jgi:type IV secretion system protein TrbD
MNDELIQVPFHRAIHRPNLIWGGDRKGMIFVLAVVAIMIIPAINLVSITIGLSSGVIAICGLRAMAKADPMMMQVYIRQLKYEDFYPARSNSTRVSHSSKVY